MSILTDGSINYSLTRPGKKGYKNHDFSEDVGVIETAQSVLDDKGMFPCTICQRSFNQRSKLQRHLRVHSNDRPYKCQLCSKSFIQTSQLMIHMRSHTGERPFLCKICYKAFTCSKQLKVHNRTHTGEKPYACKICLKQFGYNHVLKLHQLSHFAKKVYKCMICEETQASKKLLENHITKHINIAFNQQQLTLKDVNKNHPDSVVVEPPIYTPFNIVENSQSNPPPDAYANWLSWFSAGYQEQHHVLNATAMYGMPVQIPPKFYSGNKMSSLETAEDLSLKTTKKEKHCFAYLNYDSPEIVIYQSKKAKVLRSMIQQADTVGLHLNELVKQDDPKRSLEDEELLTSLPFRKRKFSSYF